MKKMLKKSVAPMIFLLLQACSETSTNKESEPVTPPVNNVPVVTDLCDPTATISNFLPITAVVATTDPNYISGAHSVITGDVNGRFSSINNFDPTGSDITIAIYGNYFYRIGRYGAGNNITKYAIDEPNIPVWQQQYSVNEAVNQAVPSNPHDMVFVSETKAYVLRYGKTKAWIVNPSATTEADFKIGELDLSAYGGIDGVPDMDSAVVANGKLFITVQRLEGSSLQPDNISYLAVFDIATDMEIDVGIKGDELKGIPLLTRNPTKIIYDKNSETIYVQGSGGRLKPLVYVSGIEAVDAINYTSKLILDDGDELSHPYGVISQMALVPPDILYFVGYNSYRDNTLYLMNLKTMQVGRANVAQLINGDISDLAVDPQGLLWVSDNANATVRILNPLSCEEIDAVSTNLNPAKIVFAQ